MKKNKTVTNISLTNPALVSQLLKGLFTLLTNLFLKKNMQSTVKLIFDAIFFLPPTEYIEKINMQNAKRSVLPG